MKKGDLELGEKPSEADIEKFLPRLPSGLPKSYIDFLKRHNGGSGDLPAQPCYFVLWELESLIEYNTDYEIQNYLPNYFGIGGNGGGEFFAFDLETLKIFTIPFIPMNEEDAILVAESFEEFEKMMGFADENEQ